MLFFYIKLFTKFSLLFEIISHVYDPTLLESSKFPAYIKGLSCLVESAFTICTPGIFFLQFFA